MDSKKERHVHHITQHIHYAPSVLVLRDIAPFGSNVVYAENVRRNSLKD